MSRIALCLLLLASGAAALIYQILWQRQLGLVFGNTAQATAATLAIFFLGLALGSWAWGERAARTRAPLRTYAVIELGIAASALLLLGLLPLVRHLHAPLYGLVGGAPLAFSAATLLLAALVLLPPAVCIGGTAPMLAQHMIRTPDGLGRIGSALIALNTLGGAGGALAAGFYLPRALGIAGTLSVAVALNLACAALAWGLARGAPGPVPPARPAARVSTLPHATLLGVAALSGFAVLGLEVLWTRMLALVLHNSVYSFAIILCTFLVGLAGGGGAAHLLCRRGAPTRTTLYLLLLGAGLAVALSPFAFWWSTDGLAYVAHDAGWAEYLGAVLGTVAGTILLPTALLGTVFPLLLGALDAGGAPGRALGRLAAVNTAGAIAGALACGFLLLDWLGLWASIRTVAMLYLAAAACLAAAPLPAVARYAPLAALLLVATLLDPGRLPITRVSRGETVRAEWESAYGVTAVVQHGARRLLRMDNHYTLGDSGTLSYERTQAELPLVLHGAPRSIFFLGLGTGITAGAALGHPVDRVTAVELVPQVIEAARAHFEPWVGGLFGDARAEVLSGDARSLLAADRTPRDVIVADLFLPWQAGAGALYTREHFATVRDRLAPGGLFAQWLPLYQLSRDEFMIIARTMLDVFPQVTLWHGDFLPERPIVALIGSTATTPLDPEAVVASFAVRQGGADVPRAVVIALTAILYAGNLGANPALFADVPLHTDDRPLIEYSSPITQREQRRGAAQWFTGESLGAFLDALSERLPPEQDPYLALLEPDERGFVVAGQALFAAQIARAAGREAEAERLADVFTAAVPPVVSERLRSPGGGRPSRRGP